MLRNLSIHAPQREKIMEEKDDWCAHCKKKQNKQNKQTKTKQNKQTKKTKKQKQKQRFFAWFALWNKETRFDSLQRFFVDTLTKKKSKSEYMFIVK